MSRIEAMTSNPPVDPKGDVSLDVAASYVLHVTGHGGYAPGGFYTKLILAALHADWDNLTRLSAGFPMTAWCVCCYKLHRRGVDRLIELADPDNSIVPEDL